MTDFPNLTGLDPNDPTPRVARQFELGAGEASGSGLGRKAVLICNKIPTAGNTTTDGLSEALNVPRLVQDESEVIERAGRKSEALLLFKTFRRRNKSTELHIALVDDAGTAATLDWTIATTATAASAVRLRYLGETVLVGIAVGDTVTTIAENVVKAVNEQEHWPISASNALGVVTITAAATGLRHDFYVDSLELTITKPAATTVSKGALTSGTTDDDQTTAIANLASYDFYYHMNVKETETTVNATDNGIGEHYAMLEAEIAPTGGKAGELFFGLTGTQAQGTTTAVSLNGKWAHCARAEDSPWSAGMIGVHLCSVIANAQLSNKAANTAGISLDIPDPLHSADRNTPTEIKADLNNGISAVQHDSTGKATLVWFVTTYSETGGNKDYRTRAGHIPSVGFELWDRLGARWNTTKQPNVAADLKRNEIPQVGFSRPADLRALISSAIDDGIETSPSILDPGEREYMKSTIATQLLASGIAASFEFRAVRHLLKSNFLLQETSPAI